MPWAAAKSVADEEYADENRDCESDVSSDCSNGENGANGHATAEDQEEKENANEGIEPNSINWGVCVLVHALNPPGEWEAAITSVCEGYSGGRHHAALTHGETTDDGETEDSKSSVPWHHLDEIRSPWLTEIRFEDRRDVYNCVCDHQLQSPSCEPSKAACHDNRSGSSNICVAALLGKMEGGIVSRHRPDDGNEAHENCHSIRPICAILDRPDMTGRKELRAGISPSDGCWNHNDNNEQPDHIQR